MHLVLITWRSLGGLHKSGQSWGPGRTANLSVSDCSESGRFISRECSTGSGRLIYSRVYWGYLSQKILPTIISLVLECPRELNWERGRLISSRVCSRSPTEGAERACARASPLPVDKAITHDLQSMRSKQSLNIKQKGNLEHVFNYISTKYQAVGKLSLYCSDGHLKWNLKAEHVGKSTLSS